MNAAIFHRRRAERFAQLLEEADGARQPASSGADGSLADLADIGHRLSRIDLCVHADPEFRNGLRAVLMATIEREGIGTAADAGRARTGSVGDRPTRPAMASGCSPRQPSTGAIPRHWTSSTRS